MQLDIRTIICIIAVSGYMLGIGIAATVRSYPRHIRRSANTWAAACLSQAVGWTLLALRDRAPDFLTIVVANTLLAVALLLEYRAVRQFKQQQFRAWPVGWLPVVVLVGTAVYSMAAPSYQARVLIVSSVSLALLLLVSYEILIRRDASFSISHALTGTGAVWCCAMLAYRMGSTIVFSPSGPTTEPLFEAAGQNIAFISLYIGTVILTFGFILMYNDKLNDELRRLATLDSLTEVFNRRTIQQFADRELEGARRQRQSLSLLMIDLDHFKRINDLYGHEVGDIALQAVVKAARGVLRAKDMIGRYGGEEFVVLLPGADAEQALVAAERLRHSIANCNFAVGGERVSLTASLGVAVAAGPDETSQHMLRRADRALYEAKARGRNRVVSESQIEPTDGNIAIVTR